MKVYPLAMVICALASSGAAQQQPKLPPVMPEPRVEALPPSPVEKIDATTYRIGEMRLDTKRKVLAVPGTVNDVTVLEFVANTMGGFKAYESALTLNTNAVSFNAALLVLGLDPARSRPSRMQFDPQPPEGDPVELMIEWHDGGNTKHVGIEELLFDQRTGKTLAKGPWVYTGSTFWVSPSGVKQFQAETDGVLIGFMHGPQSIIDNPRNDALSGFGHIILNPQLGLKAGLPITLTVNVLDRKAER